MEIDLSSYLAKFIFLVLLIQRSAGDCNSASNSLSREYTINSWTGNWTFEGYLAGPNTHNNYYLLSSAGDSQCGIICEDTSGQKVWAKTYSNGQCSGLSMDEGETSLFFSSSYSDFYAIGQVNCTDGSLINYKGTSNATISGKVTSQGYVNQIGYEFITSIGASASGTTAPYVQYLKATGSFFFYIPADATMTSFTQMLGMNVPDTLISLYAYLSSASNYELYFRNLSVSYGTASTWYYNISCTSTCPTSDYMKSDFDQLNVHVAFNLPSEGKALVMVFTTSSGDLVGNVKMTQSSEQLALGSLYATNNSATWISMYSSSSSYSELINYDASNNNYTIYKQTGYSYSFQYINSTANYAWLALGMPKVISNATQACFTNIGGLSVSETNSGLEDTTLFSLTSVGATSYTYSQTSLTTNTSITSTASDMDYSYNTVLFSGTDNQTAGSQTNSDDDDISVGEIVGIIFLCIYVLVLIAVVTFIAVYLYRRKKRYAGHRKVRAETLAECQPEEDLYSQHPQDEIQNN